MEAVDVEKQGSVTVVSLSRQYESVDFAGLREIQGLLLQLAEKADPTCLLVDMKHTDYFGSGFIGVLLRCYSLVKKLGGRFALCNVCPILREELETTQLTSIWNVYECREEALAAMTNSHPKKL